MTAVLHTRSLESFQDVCKILKSCILQEAAAAAICVVYGKVLRETKAVIS